MTTETSIETRVIDGKAVAAGLRERIAGRVRDFSEQHGRVPALTTILVGDDPASNVYVNNKHKACAEVGIASSDERLPADTSSEYLAGLIADLNADEQVDGILLQLPLPDGLDDDEKTLLGAIAMTNVDLTMEILRIINPKRPIGPTSSPVPVASVAVASCGRSTASTPDAGRPAQAVVAGGP